jgi:hypothetical protein
MVKSNYGTFVAPIEPQRLGISSLEDWPHLMFMHSAECLLGKDLVCPDVCYDTHWNFRLSALSSSSWRSQRAVVHSISRSAILSTVNMNTGLATSPTRGFPSPYIPRSSSIVFHPTEMLYGVGTPDGTGTYSILNERESTQGAVIVRIYGSNLM